MFLRNTVLEKVKPVSFLRTSWHPRYTNRHCECLEINSTVFPKYFLMLEFSSREAGLVEGLGVYIL